MLVSLFTVLLMSDGFRLVADGSLGGDGLFLGAGTTVAADDSGTLFLLDPAAHQVRVFDEHLEQVRSFGRKGKGPGEFEEPKVIALTPRGEPAVFDPTLKRLTVFDETGTVSRTVRLDASTVAMYHPVILDEDSVAFLSARSHQGRPVYDLSLYGSEAEVIENLVRIEVAPLDWSQSSDQGFWVTFLQNEFGLLGKGLPISAGLDGKTFVFARTNAYRLSFVSEEGRITRTVDREVKPVPLTEETKMAAFEAIWNRLTVDPFLFNQMPRRVFERAAEKAEAPAALPVLETITRLGKGFCVLAQYNKIEQKGRLDIFDRAGNFRNSLPYTGPADFLTGNQSHLFSVGPDSDGDVTVTRHRIQ